MSHKTVLSHSFVETRLHRPFHALLSLVPYSLLKRLHRGLNAESVGHFPQRGFYNHISSFSRISTPIRRFVHYKRKVNTIIAMILEDCNLQDAIEAIKGAPARVHAPDMMLLTAFEIPIHEVMCKIYPAKVTYLITFLLNTTLGWTKNRRATCKKSTRRDKSVFGSFQDYG